jgi:hypothetical protein
MWTPKCFIYACHKGRYRQGAVAARCRQMSSFTARLLYSRNASAVPTDQEAVWVPKMYGRFAGEKRLWLLPTTEGSRFGRPFRTLNTTSTEVTRSRGLCNTEDNMNPSRSWHVSQVGHYLLRVHFKYFLKENHYLFIQTLDTLMKQPRKATAAEVTCACMPVRSHRKTRAPTARFFV